MATRRRAREIVLQLLFENDLNPQGRSDLATRTFTARRLQHREPLVTFARGLLSGVHEHREAIDKEIAKHSTNWSISRMAVIDRNILRLGTFEILFGGTPGPVAINEAISIAKRYGDRNSGSFVNGILDRVHRGKKGK